MKTTIVAATLGAAFLVMVIGCGRSLMRTSDVEFKGKIARSYSDSKEWWPKPVRPHPDAPNVLILLLDDVGFAQLGQSFGGLIETLPDPAHGKGHYIDKQVATIARMTRVGQRLEVLDH